ncbi:MAG: cyclic nucleotide-binding domain-containing protein [Calditrichaceae bacterium]|nr:cyclic nucleotide-binding domain-containing protein [Calditrichaceae bacterium]MBN2708753.1 cyclic nucleotide-binding domain-containing protein [Calditrichaceae bacterium]RQV97120.1 MAG: response regulator [Calditrichota bacterium]
MIQVSKILQQVPIFKSLSKESIDFIVERLKFKTFDEEETICKIGDPGDEMFIIITGEVKIVIYSDDAKHEQVVAKLGSGNYFGEMALLTGETRSASVITTEKSEMFVLHKNDFDVILDKYPAISLSLGKIVSQRLRDTLKKATQMPKTDKIEAAADGPAGNLKDISLVDLISFCESNSVSGTMEIVKGNEKGYFELQSGQIQLVKMNDLKDDQALDQMLTWQEGDFKIHVRPLRLQKQASEAAKKRLLVVNNSLVVRKVIERAFTGMGYDVSSAPNISEALQQIQKAKPDVIIADIKLPDGTGAQFLESVRTSHSIPFIFLTDDSADEQFQALLDQKGHAQMTKTHEVSEIVKLVERLW